MCIGGVVKEISYANGVVSVDTFDDYDRCAVDMRQDENSLSIERGDTVWWQSGFCYWTPKSRNRSDVKIKKIGYSYSWSEET